MRQLIAYIDGGSRGNPGDAAAGVFYPYGADVPGYGLMYDCGEYIGTETNNVAEYRALILALQDALRLDYTHLRVYSDSQLIVKQMKGVYRVESESLRPLYEKAYTLACQLDFEINWVPREMNAEADAICNSVLDKVQGKCSA